MNVNIHAGIARPLGYIQFSTTGAVTLASQCPGGVIPPGTAYAIANAEAQAIRWRDDGTVPSATVGMPVAVGVDFSIPSPAAFQVIGQVAGGLLNVSFYAAGAS